MLIQTFCAFIYFFPFPYCRATIGFDPDQNDGAVRSAVERLTEYKKHVKIGENGSDGGGGGERKNFTTVFMNLNEDRAIRLSSLTPGDDVTSIDQTTIASLPMTMADRNFPPDHHFNNPFPEINANSIQIPAFCKDLEPEKSNPWLRIYCIILVIFWLALALYFILRVLFSFKSFFNIPSLPAAYSQRQQHQDIELSAFPPPPPYTALPLEQQHHQQQKQQQEAQRGTGNKQGLRIRILKNA